MTTIDGTWTYGYDDAGELVSGRIRLDQSRVPSQNLTYAYNAAGRSHADDRERRHVTTTPATAPASTRPSPTAPPTSTTPTAT